jgi:DNA-binding CsgD family transcriptional regulator
LLIRANKIRRVGSGSPLVGRTEEIAEISRAIAESGGLVLAGAAGVGKTRLVREALAVARRSGRPTRWVVATGSSNTVPLGAFAEFASSFGGDPVRWVQDVIDALTAGSDPMATVVGVDDAQLLDDLSALVVYQLVRRRLATVVLTVRTGPGAAVAEAITSLWKDESLVRIDLQPLSADEIAVLVAAVLGGDVEPASAQRFWRYTRGNVLYLRQLIADESASGRIAQRSGLWVWDGHPSFSPSLLELIEANIGRQDQAVVDVLDLLAVAESLELSVLEQLAPTAVIETAEARGVICVDTGGGSATARPSHPMFGEARRARLGTVRLRSLRGRVAVALGERGEASPQHSVRRAVLMLGSDQAPDPALLIQAAQAAMSLLDPVLAVSLTESAVRHGGGRAAQLAHGTALASLLETDSAEQVLGQLAETSTDAEELTRIAVVRAGGLAWSSGQTGAAAQVLAAAAASAAEVGLMDSIMALQVSVDAGSGHPHRAIAVADRLNRDALDGISRMLFAWGLSAAFGEAGRLDRLAAAAADGYAAARTAAEASHLRFGLGILHVHSLYLAGCIPEATAIAESLRRESHGAESVRPMTATVLGQAALHAGDLVPAQRYLREAASSGVDASGGLGALLGVCLARALAMTGACDDAQAALAKVPAFHDFALWEAERLLTVAWVHAVRGVVSKAAAVARESARGLSAQRRYGAEVLALQYATQFGDRTTADRLAELTALVQGPRVIAAGLHARGLCDRDAESLLEAARRYEEFGDRVAAADAAAQAAVALRERGLAGSAMTAAAVARRLAQACGSVTPAVRAAAMPNPFTQRQREIIALAAAGLTNRQIADRLVMSVRTVEGHLFRASQRAGVSTRDGLIALLEGRLAPRPTVRRATG